MIVPCDRDPRPRETDSSQVNILKSKILGSFAQIAN